MIAGLEEITDGEIYIDDVLINEMPPKDRNIAMVFQNYALYPHMTVFENMAFSLKLRKDYFPVKEVKVDDPEYKRRYQEIYDRLVSSDPFMVLGDFESYRLAQEKINMLYKDKVGFARICLYNIAKSAFFSSDRSVSEYANNIWGIKKIFDEGN